MFDDSSIWTNQRLELLAWFNDRAPSFSPGYQAALYLLRSSVPARVLLISHVVRDIYSRLPASLGMKATSRPMEVLPGMVTKLVKVWDAFPAKQGGTTGGIDSDVPVSQQVHKELLKIVEKKKALKSQPNYGARLATALFRSAERREDEFVPDWVIASFNHEYDFFVKRAHLAVSVEKIPSDDGFDEHFRAFERSFHSLVGSYFTGKEELDDILRDTNSRTD